MTKLADAGLFGTGQQGMPAGADDFCGERSRDPMKKFWNWKSRKIRDQDSGEERTERVLFLMEPSRKRAGMTMKSRRLFLRRS